MNWLQYILTFIVAPLVVGGVGAAIGAYAALKVLREKVEDLQDTCAKLREDLDEHKTKALTEKDCQRCQMDIKDRIDRYHKDALSVAEIVKQEAATAAKSLEKTADTRFEKQGLRLSEINDTLIEVVKSLGKLEGMVEEHHRREFGGK